MHEFDIAIIATIRAWESWRKIALVLGMIILASYSVGYFLLLNR